MKQWDETTVILFANWLHVYTKEVIAKVMEKRQEIIENEFAMKLLQELKEREEKEQQEFTENIGWLFRNFEEYKEFDPHNHCTTHANSYRDVLYDMYIKID